MTENYAHLSKPRHIILDEVASTNSKMKEIIESEILSEFSIVQTRHQYAGRGQMGNHWESEKNKNLTFSIYLTPSFLAIQDQFIISKIASIAIIETLQQLNIDDLKIKWPNDIYVKNKKIAGILIENSIMGRQLYNSIIGIGLNVNQLDFTDNAPNATSIAIIKGESVKISSLIESILKIISDYYHQLQTGNTDAIHKTYLQHLFRINEEATFKDEEGEFKGTITGIDPFGRLKIMTSANNLRTYEFKEVAFIIEKESRF